MEKPHGEYFYSLKGVGKHLKVLDEGQAKLCPSLVREGFILLSY